MIDHSPEPPRSERSELLRIAQVAAAAAVELIHDRRPELLESTDKSTATDHVTQMDQASETLIRDVIAHERPDDSIVGEEAGRTAGTSGVTWWLDPIDGTTNYIYDHPGYAVSIAAAAGDTTLAAVVADPTHGRTYHATLHGGSFCTDTNGEPRRLHLGEPPNLSQMLVATGFGYAADQRAVQGAVVAALLPRIRDIRRMGAAAVDLCSVASGRVDAFYEAGLARWDLAAGSLIASEAGARLGAIEGGAVRPGSVLACHPDRYEQLQALLISLGATGTAQAQTDPLI